MNAASLPLSTWSRSGPVVPFVLAAESVWQAPHDVAPVAFLPLVKIAFGSVDGVGPPPPACPPPPAPPLAAALVRRTQAAKPWAVLTRTVERMNAWPSPQSSAQTIWCTPIESCLGVTR